MTIWEMIREIKEKNIFDIIKESRFNFNSDNKEEKE